AELPVTPPFHYDVRMLVASLVVSLACALLCGLAPALQSTRNDLVKGLKSADVDVPGPRRPGWRLGGRGLGGRNALVVAQVSASLMLLAAAFLMARAFRTSTLQATGFAKDHLLMARLDPRLVQYDGARSKDFYRRLAAGARELPGVDGVAL